MRIISLVPSWTETLIESGANIVGRTRFCIHPEEAIRKIPVVGGTKDVDWDTVKALAPDLLILDQEENPKWMAEQAPCAFHASHVTSIGDMPEQIRLLTQKIPGTTLSEFAKRWQLAQRDLSQIKDLPGVIEWLVPPQGTETKIVYIIWRDPWMTVTSGTFIASVLQQVGVKSIWPEAGPKKYPEFEMANVPEDAVLLFSSEPFPFAKFKDQLKSFARPAALVNGESFSWFGVRSLRFLESR
jgi:ABC-type Fe3+-hydroxamate transport system substrate-binding protein